MFHGRHEETFQINLVRTREIVEYAHNRGISFETELGSLVVVKDGGAGALTSAKPSLRPALTSWQLETETSMVSIQKTGQALTSKLLQLIRLRPASFLWFSTVVPVFL